MLDKSNELDTRGRILKSAVSLFLKQGYEKTTIRQITSRAEVTTGSLYHFFSNKEEIIVTISGEIFESLVRKASDIADENGNPALGLSLEVALNFKLLEKYPTIIDVWHTVYSSEKGTALILDKATCAAIKWFAQYHRDYSCQDYYLQAIAMRGISLSFMGEERFGVKIEPEERLCFIVKTAMKIFNIPDDDIEGLVDKTNEIVADMDVSLEDFISF